MEVRLNSTFPDENADNFWIATITKITGYFALLRYEGYSGSKQQIVCEVVFYEASLVKDGKEIQSNSTVWDLKGLKFFFCY